MTGLQRVLRVLLPLGLGVLGLLAVSGAMHWAVPKVPAHVASEFTKHCVAPLFAEANATAVTRLVHTAGSCVQGRVCASLHHCWLCVLCPCE